ncbi:hypothetical protein ACFDR9_000929 [Janthinobacterium sp. CG_23.3]|uniref:hypothetical protein n=1 Tax=Janthinobacterium sp. CG_23.3 TaxID=3349634 RepID=UPI0038D3CBAB
MSHINTQTYSKFHVKILRNITAVDCARAQRQVLQPALRRADGAAAWVLLIPLPSKVAAAAIDRYQGISSWFKLTGACHMDERIKQQLSAIPSNTYLRVWGKFSSYTINAQCEQGLLKSIDWTNGTMVLHSTTYNSDNTVQLDKISSIEDHHTGSGASGPVQQADLRQVGNDWYRGDVKIE